MQSTMLLDGRTADLVREYVPEGDVLESVVMFFSIFADPTRVRLLSALAISEMCVTDLSRILNINQTTVSHQLRLLKNLGIVKSERSGKIIFYSLVSDLVCTGGSIFSAFKKHIHGGLYLPRGGRLRAPPPRYTERRYSCHFDRRHGTRRSGEISPTKSDYRG